MGASKIRSTVHPPRRDLIAPIPQSFISHNAVVEPRPPRTLAGLQAKADGARAATDAALADRALTFWSPGSHRGRTTVHVR